MPPHRFTDSDSRRGLAAMRSGGWGRVQVAVRRAFIVSPGQPLTTTQLAQWAYPRVGTLQQWQRYNVRRVASAVAARVGRRKPGGLLWRPKTHT
jgi:hypothetical protein